MSSLRVPRFLAPQWRPEDRLVVQTVVCGVGLELWSFPLGQTHTVSDPAEEGPVEARSLGRDEGE